MNAVSKLLSVVSISLLPCLAFAQAWPNKPIRAIIPFATGSGTDSVARPVLQQLSKQLGQPIIIENRPGAGGTIGETAVAHAEPDGYTILVHSSSHTVTPSTYSNLNYNALRDFAGITPLASVPMVLVTAPASGFKTLDELVKLAKAKPGVINYASAGVGGATHLGAERLRIAGGFSGTHVPYKGSSEALTEVMAGRVDYYFSPVGLALPFVKVNRLVPIAVSSSKRSSGMPDVPTSVEAGLPNSDYDVWIGMFVPVKTPRNIVNKLHEETVKALQSPEITDRFKTLTMDLMIMTPENFDAFLVKDVNMNAGLVKAAGIKAQ